MNKVCEQLDKNNKCIQVWQYSDGDFTCLHHAHIPKHRINQDDTIYLLRHLLAKYSNWETNIIIESYLNKRRGKPKIDWKIEMPIDYPESGVLRRYCSFKDVTVFADEIIEKNK